MDWLRIKLVISNSQIVSVFASYGTLVALPALLQFQQTDSQTHLEHQFFQFKMRILLAELMTAQSWLIMAATACYVLATGACAFCMPKSVSIYGGIWDFISKGEEVKSRLTATVGDENLDLGKVFRDDVQSRPYLRLTVSALIIISVVAFLLSLICSFLTLGAALV